MIHWYWILVALLAGGITTSLAEFLKNYNLIDLLKDFFQGAEKKIIAKAKAAELAALAEKNRLESELADAKNKLEALARFATKGKRSQ